MLEELGDELLGRQATKRPVLGRDHDPEALERLHKASVTGLTTKDRARSLHSAPKTAASLLGGHVIAAFSQQVFDQGKDGGSDSRKAKLRRQ